MSWRVAKGVYLELGVARKNLYRISQYEEDGSLSIPQVDGGERVITGQFWRIQRLVRETAGYVHHDANGQITGVMKAVGLDAWEATQLGLDSDDVEWVEVADMFKTKKVCLEWIEKEGQ